MKLGLLARIEAKPEHADQVEALLRDAAELAKQEQHTVTWFSFGRTPPPLASSTPSSMSKAAKGTSKGASRLP